MEIHRTRDISTSKTWSDEVSRLKRLKEEKKSFEIYQDGVDVRINTMGLPYAAVVGLSDIHLGHAGTDYEALDKYVQFVRNNPVATILAGDIADLFNAQKLAHALAGDLEFPDEQLEVARTFLQELNRDNKLIAMVSGNHEDFAKNTAMIDIYRWIARDLGIPLLQNGSVINLGVDRQDYKIAVWHKLTLNSRFNNTHAGKQAMRMAVEGVDMVMSGDKHIYASEQFLHNTRLGRVVQLGTFKVDDRWGRDMGFHPLPQAQFPVFFFDGRQHNIEQISNIDAAEEFIDLYREGFRLKAVGLLGHAGSGENPQTPTTP